MSEVLLVTGMSGAGRSTVSAALEDVGWFVIDNMPIELIVRVGELAVGGFARLRRRRLHRGTFRSASSPTTFLAVERELRHCTTARRSSSWTRPTTS